MELALVTTSHNRCSLTYKSLVSLFKGLDKVEDVSYKLFITDDGSSDGTSKMILENFNNVIITNGDGSLYWNHGIIKSWQKVIDLNFQVDGYLIFNDDVIFRPELVKAFISSFKNLLKVNKDVVLVGSVMDDNTNQISYGGLLNRKKYYSKLRFKKILDLHSVNYCDTMNMNCIMVSKSVVTNHGILDPNFLHGLGDIDYGLRLRKANVTLSLFPDYVGYCKSNQKKNTWQDPNLSKIVRLKKILSVKGLPMRNRLIFCRRHGGFFWFIDFLGPYLNLLLFNKKF